MKPYCNKDFENVYQAYSRSGHKNIGVLWPEDIDDQVSLSVPGLLTLLFLQTSRRRTLQ